MSHEIANEKTEEAGLSAGGLGSASGQDLTEKTAVPRSDQSIETASTASGGAHRNDGNDDGDGDAIEPVASHASTSLPYSKARCIALVATVTGAAFNNTFSVQSVVIILPTIGKELSIPDSRLQWIVSAYSLAFGCFLLLWGRIADLYGKKRIFVWGSVGVAIATIITPFVPNEIAFDLLRGLAGFGAAANVPTALGILGVTFPPGKAKNFAFATYGAGAPLGSILGNLLAGFIASYGSWKWVFGVMAILSGIAALVGVWVIPSPKHTLHDDGAKAKMTIDWVGAALVTLGLFGLLFALTEGNVVGWATPWIPVVIVVSALLIACFVLWQRRLETRGRRAPLMKVSMFRSKKFSAAMLIMAFSFSSFNGFMIYATYFYQSYQGLGALQTTLRFIPTGVVGVATSFVVAHLLHRVPTWILLLFGSLCIALCNLLFAIPIPSTTSYWAYGLEAMSLSVMGVDTAWPSLTLFTSQALPKSDQALGGALVNAVGQVGRAIGLAIATAIQTSVMASARGVSVEQVGPVLAWDEPSLKGLRTASWFNFAVGALPVVVAAVAFRGSGVLGSQKKAKTEESAVVARQRDEEAVAEAAEVR